MKLETANGYIVDIFSIYWIDNKTLFLGMPKKHGGLISYDSSEVKVIDSKLKGEFLYFSDNGINGICHWFLIKENLISDILERNEEAYLKFLNVVKEEGLVDPDFY